MVEKITREQLECWAVDPITNKEALIAAFEETDAQLQDEIVKIWVASPLLFFTQISGTLADGTLAHKMIINELIHDSLQREKAEQERILSEK